jgi:hypothetical protein
MGGGTGDERQESVGVRYHQCIGVTAVLIK